MEEIKRILNEYDLIVLVDSGDNPGNLAERINLSDALRNCDLKVKVISADEFPEMASLFYTYEFSDKVRIVGNSYGFGGLLNLVEAGLMSEEEVFEALVR